MLKRTPRNPDLIYAYSLFLAGQGQEQTAVRQLRSIPEKQWDNRMQELAARLEFGAVMDNARAMKTAAKTKPRSPIYRCSKKPILLRPQSH
ncbi:hypothetical protein PCI56_17575 [Plesiomonas shigelloides subsp. oncorhynchi]|nr:hypothetical protein [Plesiomonas shigelloides]